jgi:histidine ammonia-lyase
VLELPQQLYTYHGCGAGRFLDARGNPRGAATRLVSLVQGYVRRQLALLQQLVALLRHDVLPRIPAEGSVGASGDLTPLSYVAAVLCGEREVWNGEVQAGRRCAGRAGLQPLRLRPKEGLAIMNGTAVMTALACLAHGARRLPGAPGHAHHRAGNLVVIDGNPHHFDEACSR